MSKGKNAKKKSAWDIMGSFKKKKAINKNNPAPGLPSNKLNKLHVQDLEKPE